MSLNIGFVSTRFAGTDGVSLEANKWADVFKAKGHKCFWFAGELEKKPETSHLIPEAYFNHPENLAIQNKILWNEGRSFQISEKIHNLRSFIKKELYRFVSIFRIDLLVAENILSIPMHIPLGLATTELIAETCIPTIAHHHDFYWERNRFSRNGVGDYIRMSFPPNLGSIAHVVINSNAQEELALRTGISSFIIPNVLDFDNPPPETNGDHAIRAKIGLKPDDRMILQPTRIVQRKGIEHAIELVQALNDARCKLVISHKAGDEGTEYAEWLEYESKCHNVDMRFYGTNVGDPWDEKNIKNGRITLWDIYPHADFITYPSLYEGFGNAFLEAVFFRKPLLINRYSIFAKDIEPKGFDLVIMDGFLSKKNVKQVKEILEDPEKRSAMVEHNYEVAAKNYSYTVLRKSLSHLLVNFFGLEP